MTSDWSVYWDSLRDDLSFDFLLDTLLILCFRFFILIFCILEFKTLKRKLLARSSYLFLSFEIFCCVCLVKVISFFVDIDMSSVLHLLFEVSLHAFVSYHFIWCRLKWLWTC